MRGSSADQPRSSDDAGYVPGDAPAPRSPRAPGGFSGSSSGGGSGDRPPGGYQTEERYWTDYLRIALPIVGLLLLLSVFWFWASSFIGGNDNGTETPVVSIVTPEPTMTPTLQEAVVLNTPTTAPAEPTQPVTEPTQPAVEPTQPAAQPTPPPATGPFQEGDLVIVNDNDVRMRSTPSTSGEIVDTLTQGTELTILSATPTDAEGYTWWNVSETATGAEGWIAGEFLEK